MSAVLDDAEFNDDIRASAGSASLSGTTLSCSGDLAVDAVVKLRYSVTVTDSGDDELLNVVSPASPDGSCVPAPDGNPDCTTTHDKQDPPAAVSDDLTDTDSAGWGSGLPDTGTRVSGFLLVGGVLMLLAGAAMVTVVSRRTWWWLQT